MPCYLLDCYIRACVLATPNSNIYIVNLKVTVFEHTGNEEIGVITERSNSSGSSIVPALRRVTSSMPACATEQNLVS